MKRTRVKSTRKHSIIYTLTLGIWYIHIPWIFLVLYIIVGTYKANNLVEKGIHYKAVVIKSTRGFRFNYHTKYYYTYLGKIYYGESHYQYNPGDTIQIMFLKNTPEDSRDLKTLK